MGKLIVISFVALHGVMEDAGGCGRIGTWLTAPVHDRRNSEER